MADVPHDSGLKNPVQSDFHTDDFASGIRVDCGTGDPRFYRGSALSAVQRRVIGTLSPVPELLLVLEHVRGNLEIGRERATLALAHIAQRVRTLCLIFSRELTSTLK